MPQGGLSETCACWAVYGIMFVSRSRGDQEETIMPHPRFSSEEIHRRGEELYERSIRPHVETDENIGKEIVIDIETGSYEIDSNGLAASRRLLAKHPGAALYGARIGYDAVYSLGGTLTRTSK
jgi:hypothetical protein